MKCKIYIYIYIKEPCSRAVLTQFLYIFYITLKEYNAIQCKMISFLFELMLIILYLDVSTNANFRVIIFLTCYVTEGYYLFPNFNIFSIHVAFIKCRLCATAAIMLKTGKFFPSHTRIRNAQCILGLMTIARGEKIRKRKKKKQKNNYNNDYDKRVKK